jgi:hypothetical protein
VNLLSCVLGRRLDERKTIDRAIESGIQRRGSVQARDEATRQALRQPISVTQR